MPAFYTRTLKLAENEDTVIKYNFLNNDALLKKKLTKFNNIAKTCTYVQ